jgi:hypothetical protein
MQPADHASFIRIVYFQGDWYLFSSYETIYGQLSFRIEFKLSNNIY